MNKSDQPLSSSPLIEQSASEGQLRINLEQHQQSTEQLLANMLQIESVSGHEQALVQFLTIWAQRHGFEIDLFETSETQLQSYEQTAMPHIPLANRSTLVIRFPGSVGGRSLMFNAHSDVISAGKLSDWTLSPWSGHIVNGRIYGRGACDVKGPLASALATLLAIKKTFPSGLRGDVMVEIIPGEEDCVGLGTLTSYVRGYHPDGLVVLEPTEGLPRLASRGGVRFEIRVHGKSVHGTVKWLGQDAISGLRAVLEYLDCMETQFGLEGSNPLFSNYPIQRPITVDHIEGLNWQGATCDSATCRGYLELLPGDDPATWKKHFYERLSELHTAGKGRGCQLEIKFLEYYGGHELSTDHPLAKAALKAVRTTDLKQNWTAWAGFNAGCEAGLRWGLDQTPTLVWGPGSLTEAHGVDEFVELHCVHETALAFGLFALHWAELLVK